MRYPQIVIRESDGWIAKQLRELAADHRWLIREPRTAADALALARELRPTVLLIHVEPSAAEPIEFALLADIHHYCPNVAAVAVGDRKLPDADRAAWTAVLFDLGASYVLFPPLLKSMLEDAVSGLMAAAIRRAVPGGEIPAAPTRPTADSHVIDLAHEEADE